MGGPRDTTLPYHSLAPWKLSRLLGRAAKDCSLPTPTRGSVVWCSGEGMGPEAELRSKPLTSHGLRGSPLTFLSFGLLIPPVGKTVVPSLHGCISTLCVRHIAQCLACCKHSRNVSHDQCYHLSPFSFLPSKYCHPGTGNKVRHREGGIRRQDLLGGQRPFLWAHNPGSCRLSPAGNMTAVHTWKGQLPGK